MLIRELDSGKKYPDTSGHWKLVLGAHECSCVTQGGRQIELTVSTKPKFDSELRKKTSWTETEWSLSRRAFLSGSETDGKFWIVLLDGEALVVQYGKLGKYGWYSSSGQTRTKYFDTPEDARREYHKQIDKKLAEGYEEYHPRKTPYNELPAELAAKSKPKSPKKAGKTKKRKAPPKKAAKAAAASSSTRRDLVFEDGSSHKFWKIELDGTSHTVQYGRVGTGGQTKTKDFDSEDEAKASYDKLVEQKLKKGYVDDRSATAPAAGTGGSKSATKKSAAKRAAKPAAEAAEPARPAPPPVVTKVTSRIDLDPRDWFWAMWRDPDPLPKPDPRPFDRDETLEHIRAIRGGGSSFNVPYPNANDHLSAEEAEFWLRAQQARNESRSPRKVRSQEARRKVRSPKTLADALADFEPTASWTVASVRKAFMADDDWTLNFVVHLLEPEQYVERLLSLSNAAGIAPFRRHVLPYLSRPDRERTGKQVAKVAIGSKFPKNFHSDYHVSCYLAAALGLHETVETVLSKSPPRGHWYSAVDLKFGLPRARVEEEIDAQMKQQYAWLSADHLRAWLAHTELDRLDLLRERLLSADNRGADDTATVAALVRSPAMAPILLEARQAGRAPQIATDWLDTELGNATAGLVPVAAGRGKLAKAARDYLREKQRQGYDKVVEKALKTVPKADAQRLRETVLNVEPLGDPLDAKSTPKALEKAFDEAADLARKAGTEWAVVEKLPPVGVGKGVLNPEQVEALVVALQHGEIGGPHPLVVAVKDAADPELLARFAWVLFELWLGAKAPSKHKWAMHALGLLGNDDTVHELVPRVRAWPGESQHPRAVLGLECLRAIGTEVALMELSGIAQKVKFKALQRRAIECVDEIAAERGMTKDQLEDRVVPDCGLDETGTREFDFGPRTFHFSLSPENKPVVRDEEGKLRKDLPKPAKSDDEDKAEAAVAAWKSLKKSIRETMKVQNVRLENALITGRRWSPAEFDSLLVRHPFMTNLVQRLLWGGFDAKGKLRGCFRVTDERDFADVDDATTTIDGFAAIGLVHPLHVDDKTLGRWGDVFADYEIVPPFAQLGRAVYRLTAAQKKQKTFADYEGLVVPPHTMLGLLNRNGWTRGVPQDNGVFCEHYKQFYDAKVTASVAYKYGLSINYYEGEEDQTLERILFLEGLYEPRGWPRHTPRVKLGDVDPVIVSEVIADLEELKAKAV